MRELIGRLTVTDGDAATALRVIAHFDNLVEGGATRDALLRAAAALAGAPAGFRDNAAGTTQRVDPLGNPIVGGSPEPDPTAVMVDHSRATTVWLERDGEPGPLDLLILERCAQALRVRIRPPAAALTPEELTFTACDANALASERIAALQALGLSRDPVVMATPPASPPDIAARAHVAGGWIALSSGDYSTLSPPRDAHRTGLARTVEADVPGACAHAVLALQLAVAPQHGGPTSVRYEELGATLLIAEAVPPEKAAADPAIMALESLRARRPWVPQTLYHLLSGGSLREAAETLHLHHSTLQDRVEWLDTELGYQVRTTGGRLRAANAWTLWRISGLLHAA